MSKKNIAKIVFIVIPIILIAIFLFLYKSSAIRPAYLVVENGTISILREGREISFTPQDGEINLMLNDKIMTDQYSEGVVVIYESFITHLDPNTTLYIKNLIENNVTLYQERGSTWNKLIKLAGINANIETSTTIASVRGTEFGIFLDRGYNLIVVEGEVFVTPSLSEMSREGGETINDQNMNYHNESKIVRSRIGEESEEGRGKGVIVKSFHKYRVDVSKGGGINSFIEEISPEDRKIIVKHLLKTKRFLEKRQKRMILRHKLLVSLFMQKYNLKRGDLDVFIESANRGEVNLSNINSLPLKRFEKKQILTITREIIETNKLLSKLNATR